MASIQRKKSAYYCQFSYLSKRHTITVGTADDMSPDDVEAFAGNVDHLLFRLKRNYLQLPAGVHITDFILNNGNVPATAIKA
ncbi:MAG: hypothetical protein K8T89_06240 [Planctomycetes bacterium]|nr:hypothetical protein [Planctomycetota bacterium]